MCQLLPCSEIATHLSDKINVGDFDAIKSKVVDKSAKILIFGQGVKARKRNQL